MFLHALGTFHPPAAITNAFLESLDIGTTEDWILERVGIHERRTVLPLDYIRATKNRDVRAAAEAATMSNADTGAAAARAALARAGVALDRVGMVVSGGCTPDEHIPSTASRVAEALGVDAPCFDVGAACSSFVAALHVLSCMRPEKLPDFVLIVNPENSTRVVDYSDRTTAVLWGDASIAAVVSPREPGAWRIVETLLGGDPAGADKVKVPRFGHFAQSGASVQRFAIERAAETFTALRKAYVARDAARSPWSLSFVGHQANLRMLEAVARRCEVPADKHFFNVDRRGNCGAAGAPSVLCERWDDDAVGDAVGLAVVGAGLAWAGALLERAPQ